MDSFGVTLTRREKYHFEVEFQDDGGTVLRMDEPEPLGEGSGPNAVRVLAGAVGNCLSASLIYCLEKARVDVGDVRTSVSGTIVRNERGRLRVGALTVRIDPDLRGASPARVRRCLEIFEDFCTVTESVRAGLDVDVEVRVPNAEDRPLAESVA